jgi:hypothetical protein
MPTWQSQFGIIKNVVFLENNIFYFFVRWFFDNPCINEDESGDEK